MLCIVGEWESAHAKLEARITLRYVQCGTDTYIEKSPVQFTRRACSARQLYVHLYILKVHVYIYRDGSQRVQLESDPRGGGWAKCSSSSDIMVCLVLIPAH